MSADRQSRPGVTPWRGRAFRAARLLLAAAALVLVAHEGIVVSTRIAPPAIVIDDAIPIDGPDGVRRLGKSYTTVRAGVREVYLEGSPEQIGAAHSRLLYDRMVANERR